MSQESGQGLGEFFTLGSLLRLQSGVGQCWGLRWRLDWERIHSRLTHVIAGSISYLPPSWLHWEPHVPPGWLARGSPRSFAMWASPKSSSQRDTLVQDVGAMKAIREASTKMEVTSFCFCKLITEVTSSHIAVFHWLEASYWRRGVIPGSES